MSRPSIDNPPELGDSSPAMSRNKVVFPDPDGPSTTSSSPEADTQVDRFQGRDSTGEALR